MKTTSILTVLLVTTVLGAIPAGVHAEEKAAKKGKKPAAKAEEKKSVTSEAFGQLTLGLKPAEVAKLLGEPESKGKKLMQEATGTSVQDWNYPAKGLTLTMETAGKSETLSMIQATGSCTLATARGIKIGSTEAEVKKAYAKEQSKEGTKDGESFLAGSLYDGLSFSIKDGKVTDIVVGVTAE